MKLNLAVIYGGRSGEHEVSIRSAESIMNALDSERYNVLPYFISKEGIWDPRPISPEPGGNPGIDVVFPALHGTFGEDGTIQGLLELAGIPYVGPGVLASSSAMDKEVTKRLLREAGIPVVEYVVARHAADCSALPFCYPVFVKPANLGSSVGISKAADCEQLRSAFDLARKYDRKVIIERTIAGKELECSVLGNEEPMASEVCEILPSREFYDYDDKYLLDRAEFRLPADITPEQSASARAMAVAAYSAVQCEGMSRVDFLLEASSGQLYVNEINTIPGFTSISMYPKMWEYSGVPYFQLLDRLVELALERAQSKQGLRYSR